MIVCPKCKNENPSSTNYCMHCGFAISEYAKEKIQKHQKVDRTKRIRELEENYKSLEREYLVVKVQKKELKDELADIQNENHSLHRQVTEIKNQLSTRKVSLEKRKENTSIIIPMILIVLILIFVLLIFHA